MIAALFQAAHIHIAIALRNLRLCYRLGRDVRPPSEMNSSRFLLRWSKTGCMTANVLILAANTFEAGGEYRASRASAAILGGLR